MGTVSRTAPLRRTGSLLGLLALEVTAVLGLHWLGRFAGLQVRWDEPVPWLLDSPIQDVLGSLLRMVALVMAYWLLASTVAYLLASLTRLPGAVRAVGWATLPLVRRVADHAVAVTLATSMVGGTTLGVAGPALAADSRSLGPPAPKPVAAAGATGSGAQDGPTTTDPQPTRTSGPVYTPDPADQVPTTAPKATPPPPTTEPEPTPTSRPAYTPDPADQAPRRVQENQPATTTTTETTTTTTQAPTTTTRATTTTEGTTTTTGATNRSAGTTTTRTEPTATTAAPATKAPATTAAPTTASTAPGQGAAAPTTASTSAPERQGSAAGTPATTHAYVPNAASDSPESGLGPESSTTTTTTNPGGGSSRSGGSSNSGGGGGEQGTGGEAEQAHRVVGGDNLWKIAREHLLRERSGGSGEPTNREVAAYWVKVVEANRDRLHSGDPDLIYPGERITLPPVD
jgi:uncharacterized membrane protein YgcG